MATATRSRSKLPTPKHLGLLPPLPVVIRSADGSSNTVYIPDPRIAFAAAFEADSDGATCHLPPHAGVVVIVETPDDWRPSGLGDVPPNVEIHRSTAPASLAAGFNGAELATPKGYWALAVDSLLAVDSIDDDATACETSRHDVSVGV